MKIGMVVTGVVFLGIGGAAAYFLPPIIKKASEEKANVPLLTAASAKQAAEGDRLMLHGKLSDKNDTFEKDLVIGAKQVWGISANPNEREDYRRKSHSEQSKDERTEQWWPAEDFKRTIKVSVKGVGDIALSPHSGIVAGNAATAEEKVGGEKFKWEGARRGAEVSAYVKVTDLDPLEVETQMGDMLFVGKPDQLREMEKKGDRFTVYAMYGLGGLFAFIGLITLIFGFVKK